MLLKKSLQALFLRRISSASLKKHLKFFQEANKNVPAMDQSFELEFDQRLNPLNKNVPCDKRSCKESLPSNTISSYSAGKDNEGNGETTLDGNPVTTLKSKQRNYQEAEGNGNELPVQASKMRRHPLFLIIGHISLSRLRNLLWTIPLGRNISNLIHYRKMLLSFNKTRNSKIYNLSPRTSMTEMVY